MKLQSVMLLWFALLQGVQTQGGSVQGVVFEMGSGKPLRGATVLLRGDGRSPLILVRDTRSDGTFEFRNVPTGTYEIEAKRAGYIPAVYGERKRTRFRDTRLAPVRHCLVFLYRLYPAQ